jgi:hypothetical protein
MCVSDRFTIRIFRTLYVNKKINVSVIYHKIGRPERQKNPDSEIFLRQGNPVKKLDFGNTLLYYAGEC